MPPSFVVPLWLSYAAVVAIWSTTPLFLFLSTRAFPAELAGGLRMAAAAVITTAIVWATGRTLPRNRAALITYAAMLPGVFGAMYLSYLAAATVPSGLISVLFGLSPVITAITSRLLRIDPLPSVARLVAAFIAISGLVLITRDTDRGMDHVPVLGISLVIAAVLLFSISAVLVRKFGAGLDALSQTAGALWLSLPFYTLAWIAKGAPLPMVAADDFLLSLAAIGYLALFGSVIGFVCYYDVLKRMPASSAALITVITPVFALMLGAHVNDERFTGTMLAGAALVLAGVAGFQLSVPAWVLVHAPAWLKRRAGIAQAAATD